MSQPLMREDTPTFDKLKPFSPSTQQTPTIPLDIPEAQSFSLEHSTAQPPTSLKALHGAIGNYVEEALPQNLPALPVQGSGFKSFLNDCDIEKEKQLGEIRDKVKIDTTYKAQCPIPGSSLSVIGSLKTNEWSGSVGLSDHIPLSSSFSVNPSLEVAREDKKVGLKPQISSKFLLGDQSLILNGGAFLRNGEDPIYSTSIRLQNERNYAEIYGEFGKHHPDQVGMGVNLAPSANLSIYGGCKFTPSSHDLTCGMNAKFRLP